MESNGVYLAGAAASTKIDDAFNDVLSKMLHEPGEASRNFTIRLAVEFCKKLELKGSRGDISLVAKKVGISHQFSAKILHSSLNGTEKDLFAKKRKSSSFHETDWPAKLNEFVFQPEFARAVPG